MFLPDSMTEGFVDFLVAAPEKAEVASEKRLEAFNLFTMSKRFRALPLIEDVVQAELTLPLESVPHSRVMN